MSSHDRHDPAHSAENTEKNSVCPRCGDAFGCGAKAGLAHCWCVELPALAAPDLSASCYCPRCLKEVLEERAG